MSKETEKTSKPVTPALDRIRDKVAECYMDEGRQEMLEMVVDGHSVEDLIDYQLGDLEFADDDLDEGAEGRLAEEKELFEAAFQEALQFQDDLVPRLLYMVKWRGEQAVKEALMEAIVVFRKQPPMPRFGQDR